MSVIGLEVENLCIQFKTGPSVLENLSLSIAPGHIVALVGPSGCGKSTLLRAIAGLQEYQSGTIQLEAVDADHASASASRAFVFQDATLLPWRTVWENVQLPLELSARCNNRCEVKDVEEEIRTVLQSVALTSEQWHLFPRQLSGGMQMRTSIARALVTDPNLLLLDEPFAALDDLLRTKLNQLLLDLWQARQRTILFITHNIAEAVSLSHSIAIIAKKRVARVIPNTLPWPRIASDRASLDFAQMYSTVSQALADETTSD